MSSLVGKHVRDGNVMALEASQTQWKDERTAIVERMLAGGGKPGVMEPAQLVGKSGLELLRGMLRGELPYPYIADTLDFALMAVEAGTVTFQGTPQLKHYNPMGAVHGGWYATLLDSALGCAVQSVLPAGRGYTTVELSMNIVRAASHQTGPLRAIATVMHSGRQLATAEARIVGPDGKLYAHATTACLVFE
jgi:uncharacterized protein (TIGR00369 family)